MLTPPTSLDPCEGYERIQHLQSGAFGMAYLERDKATGEQVAIKYIPRGATITTNVQRETVSHRMLRHPNIIAFRKALLTPTHLAIVMEYAAGGELFSRIASAPGQRFGEPQACFFFRQLLAGVAYVHGQQMAHRDLKLENTLLIDPGPKSRLAICDFGYTKSEVMHSAFHTNNVGTPSYLAPELLTLKQGADYDGKAVDVWAAGVVLYVMLVGGYPFGDVGNGWDLVKRIATASYSLPVPVTPACTDLLSRIFVVDPTKRATVTELQAHAWCAVYPPGPTWPGPTDGPSMQTREQLMELLRQAAAKEEDLDMGFSEAEHSAALMHDAA